MIHNSKSEHKYLKFSSPESLTSEFGVVPLTEEDFGKAQKLIQECIDVQDAFDLWFGEFEKYWIDYKGKQYPPLLFTRGEIQKSDWTDDNPISALWFINNPEDLKHAYDLLVSKYGYYRSLFKYKSPQYLLEDSNKRIEQCIEQKLLKIIGELSDETILNASCVKNEIKRLKKERNDFNKMRNTYAIEIDTITYVLTRLKDNKNFDDKREKIDKTELQTKRSEELQNRFSAYDLKGYIVNNNIFKEDGITKFIGEVCSETTPYGIALLDEIGYIDYFTKEYCSRQKSKRDHKLSQIFDLSSRNIKGNINVLIKGSKEDRERFTSHNYIDTAKDFIKGLLKGL